MVLSLNTIVNLDPVYIVLSSVLYVYMYVQYVHVCLTLLGSVNNIPPHLSGTVMIFVSTYPPGY